MKRIYVITCELFPPIFFKAESGQEALSRFSDGIASYHLKKFINHPSFTVRELTMPLLVELAPDAFKLDDECGF